VDPDAGVAANTDAGRDTDTDTDTDANTSARGGPEERARTGSPMSEVEYQLGACNIGEGEQRQRYGVGAVGMLATLGFVVGVITFDAPRPLLLATAVPLFGAAFGFLQGRLNFCVNYALRGLYDVSQSGTNTREVSEGTARRADRRRATQVIGYAAALAVGGALVTFAVGSIAG
jgi:hypothetical protein